MKFRNLPRWSNQVSADGVKKVLFVHEVSYQDKPIFEMHEFPEGLSAEKWEVTFIDLSERMRARHRLWEYRQIDGRVDRQAKIRLFTQITPFLGLPGRLFAALSFVFVLLAAIRKSKPNIIVCYSVPTSGWQTLLVAKLKGIPLVYRAIDVSHLIRKTRFAPLVKLVEELLYSKADWVSANNPAMLEYGRNLGASKDRSSCDLPPLDISHFRSASPKLSQLRKSLGVDGNKRVIVYMGSFFYFSGLEDVIRDLSLQKYSDLTLLLIGGGEMEPDLRALVAELRLENQVIFTGMIPYSDLPQYLRLGHIAINPMKPGMVSHKAFPHKVIQYMAAGLPVVSTKLDGLCKTFGELPGLQLVANSGEVMFAVRNLLESPQLKNAGASNSSIVAKKFSTRVALSEFSNLLQKVGSGHV